MHRLINRWFLPIACLAAGPLGCDDSPMAGVEGGRPGDDDGWVDGGAVPSAAAETVYYVRDHTRSVVATVGPGGERLTDVGFDAYGMPTADARADWAFAGMRADPGSGLVDFGARQYSARLGRFYDVDPIFKDLAAGQPPMRYEAYSYAASDPINLTDRGGLAAVLHVYYGADVPGGLPSGTGLLFEIDDHGAVVGDPRVVSVNNPGIDRGTLTMFFEDEDADDVLDETFDLPQLAREHLTDPRPNLVHDAWEGSWSRSQDVTVVRTSGSWAQAPRPDGLRGRTIDVRPATGAAFDPWARDALVSQGRAGAVDAMKTVSTMAPAFRAATRGLDRRP